MCENERIEMYELPEIVTLEQYGGDILAYIEGVYQIFKNDFCDNRPVFEGKRLGLKKHPYINGKEYTFYHLTHQGSDENDREPDLRRMERIPWPAPMINDSTHEYLKVWRKKHGSKNRIKILHEKEGYIVILEDRGDFMLPWTAYLITYPNRMRRILKEFSEYKGRSRPV